MLHRTYAIVMAALILLGVGAAQEAGAALGAGTITARAQVISDHPSREAQEAGAAFWRARHGAAGTSGAPCGDRMLVADGVSQLSIVSTPGKPAGQCLVIEFVAN